MRGGARRETPFELAEHQELGAVLDAIGGGLGTWAERLPEMLRNVREEGPREWFILLGAPRRAVR